jgi:hypothetical protein
LEAFDEVRRVQVHGTHLILLRHSSYWSLSFHNLIITDIL